MNPTVTDATNAAAALAEMGCITRLRLVELVDGPGKPTRWEEFAVPWRANMNVISCRSSSRPIRSRRAA